MSDADVIRDTNPQESRDSNREARQCKKSSMAEILPGLWIGSMSSLRNLKEVPIPAQESVSWTIISIVSSPVLARFVQTAVQELQRNEAANDNKKKLVVINKHVIWDLPDQPQAEFLSDSLQEILDLISTTASHTIDYCLVHCARGVSRSAALCAAWLIVERKKTLMDAMSMIRKARPQANPNLGFLAALRAIEKCQGNVHQAKARLRSKSSSSS